MDGEDHEASKSAASQIERLLEDARSRLVDTGTRNRLVHVGNLDQPKPRGKVLNVVNERSDDIYRILVTERKTMRFEALGADEDADDESDGPTFDLFSGDVVTEDRYTDTNLETPLSPDRLHKKLLSLDRDAKTSEDEQGVNILYLSLGYLKWREDKASAVDRFAPLILVPVSLVRNKKTATFDLKAREEELSTNLPLQSRLKADFGLDLPEIEDDEAFCPEKYFAEVRDAVSMKAEWEVRENSIQLGFFSFAKFLMWRDLQADNWPGGELLKLDVMERLLTPKGFDPVDELFPEGSDLDEFIDPSELVQVVDADSSQTKVIEEVRAGRHLVVQGPPGTGKSQTITNILAAAIQDGKTVLFVAEKMAALSVVYQRMVKCGLGDACLELHSKAANKKALLGDLKKTLSVDRAKVGGVGRYDDLRAQRDRLRSAATAIHRPMGEAAVTPFQLIAHQAASLGAEVPIPSFEVVDAATISIEEASSRAAALKRLATKLEPFGRLADHPLSAIRNNDLTPIDRAGLASKLSELANDLAEWQRDAEDFAAILEVPSPENLIGAQPLIGAIQDTRGAPVSEIPLLATILNCEEPRRLKELCELAVEREEVRKSRSDIKASSWKVDVSELQPALKAGARSFFSRLFGQYREASQNLGELVRTELPRRASDRLAIATAIGNYQDLDHRIQSATEFFEESLGSCWQGDETPFTSIQATIDWAAKPRETSFSRTGLARVATHDAAPELARAYGALLTRLRVISSELQVDWPVLKQTSAETTATPTLINTLSKWAESIDEQYTEWLDLLSLVDTAARHAPQLLQSIESKEVSPAEAESQYILAWAHSYWKKARKSESGLHEALKLNRSEVAEEFRHLDNDLKEWSIAAVQSTHIAGLPSIGDPGYNAIKNELAKKRKYKPIRVLMTEAGPSIQKAKPVMMMSPISVAQFLTPGRHKFDLLVIDEASQVRPEDAIGAIARCEQIVVVGDQKQLPPTNFFDRLASGDDGGIADDEDLDGIALASELESILTLCEARHAPVRMLEWHYRSKDPSLIAVSNEEYYDGRLVLPPSPLQDDP